MFDRIQARFPKFFKIIDLLAEFCEKRKWITYLLIVASVSMLIVCYMLTPELSRIDLKRQAATEAREVFLEKEKVQKLNPHWNVDGRIFRWCAPQGTSVVCGKIGHGGEKINEAIFMTPPEKMFKVR